MILAEEQAIIEIFTVGLSCDIFRIISLIKA